MTVGRLQEALTDLVYAGVKDLPLTAAGLPVVGLEVRTDRVVVWLDDNPQ